MRVIAIDGPAGLGQVHRRPGAGRPPRPRLPRHRRDVPGRHLRGAAARHRPRRRRRGGAAGRATSSSTWRDGTVIVDGVDATIEIRGPEVTRAVSIVAANPPCATEMRRRQREWAERPRRRGDRGPRHRHGRVPRRRAEGVPHRRARGAGRAARSRRSPTSTTRRWRPTSPAATRSTRAASTARSPSADDAVVIDTTDARSTTIVDEIMERLDDRRLSRDGRVQAARTRGARSTASSGSRSSASPSCGSGGRGRGPRARPDDRRVHRSRRCTARTSTSPLAVARARTRRLRYMGKDSLWKCEVAGPVPDGPRAASRCTRGTADREALRACIDVIEPGEPLVMFPEGTRQTGPGGRRSCSTGRPTWPPNRRADRAGRHRRVRASHAQGLEVHPAGRRSSSWSASRSSRRRPTRAAGLARRAVQAAAPPSCASRVPVAVRRRPASGRNAADRQRLSYIAWRGRPKTFADQRLEVLERQGVVVGVERDLVPLVGELLGERELLGRSSPRYCLAGVRVAAEVLVVVPALEVLVDAGSSCRPRRARRA